MAKRWEFRCYARRRGHKWYTHCIDLTLDAEGESYWQARENLDRAVLLYLRSVMEKGLEDELIPRQSPLSFRLTYYGLWFSELIGNLTSKLKSPVSPVAAERAFHVELAPARA
jgi:hypothetical protein